MLCHEHHQGTNGVHGKNGAELGDMLKIIAQKTWEQNYIEKYPYKNHAEDAAREAWIRLFGHSYL